MQRSAHNSGRIKRQHILANFGKVGIISNESKTNQGDKQSKISENHFDMETYS